jgi:hypothetical protein
MGSDKTTRIEGSLKVEGELKLTNDGSTTAPPTQAWLEEHGVEQLGQLSALEMNQDRNHWSSSGLYAAANTVIIVAVISALDLRILENNLPLKAFAVCLLSLIGAFIATTWFLIAVRSHTYEILWIEKSFWLERQCSVPPQCSVWESKPPEGTSGWLVIRLFIGTFYWIWVIIAATAMCFLAYWALPAKTILLPTMFAIAIIVLFAGGWAFWHYQIERVGTSEQTKKDLLKRLWPPDGKKPDQS